MMTTHISRPHATNMSLGAPVHCFNHTLQCSKPVCGHIGTHSSSLNQRGQVAARASVTASPNDATSSSDAAVEIRELRYGVAAEQGPREDMEDIIQVIPDAHCGFLFATVYDGHAGRLAAEYLHKNLYSVFGSFLQNNSLSLECALEDTEEGLCCPIGMHSILTDSYKRADQDLLKYLDSKKGDERSSGCTATTVLLRSDRVIVANVGDSRAVMSRSGTAIDLSTEHRVYGRGPVVESETARVEAAGGWIDDGRVCGVLAVSRAFGDADFKGKGLAHMLKKGIEEEMWDADFAASRKFTADPVTAEPDVLEMAVKRKDEFLVVATDGLWDVIGSQDVVNLARAEFRKGKTAQEVAEFLTSVALKRYTADNVAVVVVDLKGEEEWQALGKPGGKKLFGLF